MSDWKVGGTYAATPMSRRMINAQMSPLSVSVNSLYIIDDLMVYKERALNTHIVKALPKFMLNTPAMKRRAKAVDTLLERIQSVHTSAQRAGSPRDLADDIDQYRPPRNEHFSPGYAPYGLGTHMCLGFRWMELQLAVNVLMVAFYFKLEVSPSDYKLRFSPLPSMKPNKKLRFRIAERWHEIQA